MAVWSFIFRPPPSAFVTAMTVVSFASLARIGFSESAGEHLRYSKFWKPQSGNPNMEDADRRAKVSSRTGMLIAYAPAFVTGVASLGLFSGDGMRVQLLASALSLHFLKRILEVLFVHRYSGGMTLDTILSISLSYFSGTATMIYCQHLTQVLQEPQIDLKLVGVALFLIGVSGNFCHHYLLSKLRRGDEKEYKIPKGALFNLVICPHYLFEIIGFIGFSCIAQTLYSVSFTMGTIIYLMGRSYATRRWYLSKFEDFPKEIKALIPYVF